MINLISNITGILGLIATSLTLYYINTINVEEFNGLIFTYVIVAGYAWSLHLITHT